MRPGPSRRQLAWEPTLLLHRRLRQAQLSWRQLAQSHALPCQWSPEGRRGEAGAAQCGTLGGKAQHQHAHSRYLPLLLVLLVMAQVLLVLMQVLQTHPGIPGSPELLTESTYTQPEDAQRKG